MTDAEDYVERLRHTGRNDICPCGSGRKYKKCHLQEDEEKRSRALAETAREAAAKAAESGEEGEKEEPAHPHESRVHKGASGVPRPKPGAVVRQISTPRKAGTS